MDLQPVTLLALAHYLQILPPVVFVCCYATAHVNTVIRPNIHLSSSSFSSSGLLLVVIVLFLLLLVLLLLFSISNSSLLLLSSSAAKYDAEKEAKELKDAKEKQLKQIEEAKKKATEPKGLFFCKSICTDELQLHALGHCMPSPLTHTLAGGVTEL